MTKTKIITITSLLLALALICAVVCTLLFGFKDDECDTEALFKSNVSAVGYENTIETAYPETDIYTIIENHFNSALPEGKTEKKAILIGYDGCRADVLTEMKNKGGISYLIQNGGSCNLGYCGGVNYPEVNTQDTSTAPGWCSMVTGVWAEDNGISTNRVPKEVEPKTLMTSLVEDGIIDSSAFITMWGGHFADDNSTYKPEKEYCEANGINVAFTMCDSKSDIHKKAMAQVESADCADFVFVIYENTDSAGHNFGFSYNNPLYKNAFHTEDSYGYSIIKAIEERDTYETEDWLIIITSDHGGFGTDHGDESIQERMIFIVMNKDWE